MIFARVASWDTAVSEPIFPVNATTYIDERVVVVFIGWFSLGEVGDNWCWSEHGK